MKRIIVLLTILAGFACDEDALSPPEIHTELNVVYMDIRPVDADTPPYEFDLQIYNRGEETLKIESVRLRGDQYCHLTFQGPDTNEVDETGAFIRFFYSAFPGQEDQIALEITSNSHKNPTLLIPMCGKGVYPEDDTTDQSLVCNVPPPDQPDCLTR